jgi:dTDP-4-amino-4,6-dideoxygalactose transaminase
MPHISGTELNYIHTAFADNWVAQVGPHVNVFEYWKMQRNRLDSLILVCTVAVWGK